MTAMNASSIVTESSRKAFERFAEVAVSLPPEMRTTGLGRRYDANSLDFALNNGLAMTAGGRIWASWISGGDGPGSFTVAGWSDDGGESWTGPRLVIDGHDGTIAGRTNIIGTFWLDPEGRLHCFTDQSLLHFDGRAGFWDSICDDPDAASPTWSAPRRIGHGHLMNKPIVLRDGSWALAAYLNGTWEGYASFPGAFPDLDAERGAVCYVSSDHGASWDKRGIVLFPAEDRNGRRVEDWQEPQLLESPDGATLRLFARVIDGSQGCLMASESRDGGFTWTPSHRLASMDNANARFQILRLQSGRLLFVKHGEPAKGAPAWSGRERLTAYLSDDEGESWQGGLLLDAGCGSYPDCFQSPEGDIYVSHDHGRAREAEIWLHRFREEDVLARRPVSAACRLGTLVFRAMCSAFNLGRFGG